MRDVLWAQLAIKASLQGSEVLGGELLDSDGGVPERVVELDGRVSGSGQQLVTSHGSKNWARTACCESGGRKTEGRVGRSWATRPAARTRVKAQGEGQAQQDAASGRNNESIGRGQ